MDRMLSVLITVFLFLFTGSALAADCEKLIVTGHPSYPPVAWKEGNRIVGASLKMVEMIAQDLGLKVESKFMGSWEDAQEAIRKGTADIIFGIYYNDVRAAYMNYIKPAYMKDPVVLLVPEGKTFPYTKWSDLKGKKGVSNKGESYGPEFDEYMAKNLNIIRGDGVEECFQILLQGKAEYMIIGLYPGMDEEKKLKIENKIEILPRQLNAFKMFVAFSKKSPCYEKYQQAFSQRIKAMVESGAVQTLLILSQAEWDRLQAK